MKRHLFLLSFFLICVNYTFSIHPTVRNFNRKTTKAGTQNWSIIQHQNNWMYFANNHGLLEFDGNRWSLYPIQNHTNVRALHYDVNTNRIYAGAFNEFGYYERDENGILNYHSLMDKIEKQEQSFNEIWGIHQINNTLYFQGGNEIFQYGEDKIRKFSFQSRINSSGVVHNMYLIAVTGDGVLMQNGNLFIPLPNSEIMKEVKVCAILPYQDNQILFVTDFNGIFVFNGERTIPMKTDIDNFMFENQVFCADIKDNKLAIGTVRNGVVVRDLENQSNTFSNIYSGLQNNTVLSTKFDSQNNLWLGLDKGIDYVQINSPVYDLFGNSQLYGAGYTSLVKDGFLYLGTNQGLYVTDYPVKNTPSGVNVTLLPKMQGQVWSLREIDGEIFCGTDHGAFIIKGKNVRKISGVPGTWGFRKLENHPGCILGSSYQGFFILKKSGGEHWEFSNFVAGFTDSGGMFEEDEDGSIWFSHWIKGISKLTLNEKLNAIEVIEPFDTSKGFYTDRNNILYRLNGQIIFSSDGGFFEYDRLNNNVKHATHVEEIFGYYPTSVGLNESADGKNIWMVTPWSVELAIIQNDGSYLFDRTSFAGLKNKLIPGFDQFNFINDHLLIVNTEDGFSWTDVNKRDTISEHIKVAVRDVYLTAERDSLVGGYFTHQVKIPEFKHKTNSLRFEFVASEYRDDISVTYSHFLENYDTDWSVFSTSNTKEYTRLPKGNYTFRVKAQSMLDNEIVEASYRFTILPPWYESGMAFVVYALIALAVLFVLFRFIQKKSEEGARKMQVKKEKEMQEQEERFMADAKQKEKEIVKLKNQKLQYELRHKSQELASSTMNLIRKNEILLEINQNLDKVAEEIKSTKDTSDLLKRLVKMQDDIKKNIERDDNWKKFEANFDMVYENYLKRLGEQFPVLTVSDKKLCAYLKMGLSSKDIAPLLNMSFRSVEMSRYRLRKKLDLNREVNLTEFLQNF